MKKVFYGLVTVGLIWFMIIFSFVRKVEIKGKDDRVAVGSFVAYDLARSALGEGARVRLVGENYSGELVEVGEEFNWTSPVNVMRSLQRVSEELSERFPEEAEEIKARAGAYVEEFNEIDLELREMIKGAERRELVYIGEFPFQALAEEYGLELINYSEAGGSGVEINEAELSEEEETETELSGRLETGVRDFSVIFKAELSDNETAEGVARETGARLLEFHSGWRVSETELREGVTWAELMRRNLKVLREGLR